MRLINTRSLELGEFTGSHVPNYAILPHTWSDDEVTLQDMRSIAAHDKAGFHKFWFTCRQALKDDLEWAWVDTSVELSKGDLILIVPSSTPLIFTDQWFT
ncbi:hypothetical protein F4775DRAFT_592481 [Biscogniauxia sp. FL1348]|nr:hypothetical protein F4775DRAFT_592481 [Biscogniauxia sp. FL1348]